MCFTSQENLLLGIHNSGLNVCLINKDRADLHEGLPWDHIEIKSSNITGFKSFSLARKMDSWLTSKSDSSESLAIVDWRLIKHLHKTLDKLKIPWILLDRSPPASNGLLAKLQWPIWKKAWRLVAKTNRSSGSVVSQLHCDFVQDHVSIQTEKIFILPAGVDLERFTPTQENKTMTLIYHGRLDSHRGVLALPQLISKAKEKNVQVKLILIGDGDCVKKLELIAKKETSIEIHSQMSREQLAIHLRRATIGLLPMPNRDIWRISSPLKMSEYCASGLLICGIDHDGHRFDGENKDWIKLCSQQDFHDAVIEWVSSLDDTMISEFSHKSRTYAEENLDWQFSVTTILTAIHKLKSS